MSVADNPYLDLAHASVPRVLSLFDSNPLRATYGVGDRDHWGWKFIDYGNGTYQGAVHGIARLLAADMLPRDVDRAEALSAIDRMFAGLRYVTRADGSLEEAFPYESSFCVTALVTFDLLCAIELLRPYWDSEMSQRQLERVRPLIRFLLQANETHAVIANHLATGAAALYRWQQLSGEMVERRAGMLLQRVRASGCEEGWWREYDGADPGYQTLTLQFLADIDSLRADLGLADELHRAVEFLAHFAHPDGSFGGYYGSRNTRFYYPAGVETLSARVPLAAALALHMRSAVMRHAVVGLAAMDDPNLVPMFNSYCWAATLVFAPPQPLVDLPCHGVGSWRRRFPRAGLIIDKGARHYTVVSTAKGGVLHHYGPAGALVDTGAVLRSPHGRYFSVQEAGLSSHTEEHAERLEITAALFEIHGMLPTPWKFIVLRLLNVTAMRLPWLREWIKQLLVHLLITAKKRAPYSIRRRITLGPQLGIEDELIGTLAVGWELRPGQPPFSAIHMASQGYWQAGDQ